MSTFQFFAGDNFNISNLNGSGLGFYSSTGFGSSVQVGAYNGSTYITDSNGTIQGPVVDNVQWTHPNSGTVNGVTGYNLLDIGNYLATLNVRFNHSSAVRVQNTVAYIYDRSNKNNDPSGVTCKVAEIIHPSLTLTGNLGSGDSSWLTAHGSGQTISLVGSPGLSGLSPNGTSTTDMNHDWFLAISASPDSIGSKTQFGLFVECEYL